MKIYNILTSTNRKNEDPFFLSDGFNFKAFLFGIFWTFYNKMWKFSFIILTYTILIAILKTYGVISSSISSALSLLPNIIVGIYANEWLQKKLLNKDYILSNIICENSSDLARKRYFDRNTII